MSPVWTGEALAGDLSEALEVDVSAADATGTVTLDVPATGWVAALTHARDAWGCDMLDWLSAVDEPDDDPPSVHVVAHVVAAVPSGGSPMRRLLLRTRVPSSEPALESATGVWRGAAWHERETHEMFGVDFAGFDDGTGMGLRPLLLPDGFEGTPLRKSFVLASRAAKPWPGAKEPGESEEGQSSPSRRKLLPPGVPDAATWGPRPAGSPALASADSGAGTPEGADVTGNGKR